LAETDFTPDVARLLRSAGPWGQGFPEPVFDGVFEIMNHRIAGERHLKLIVRPKGGACTLEAMVFNLAASGWREGMNLVHMLYRLEENEYQGLSRAQLTVTHLQPVRA
jgi:single-stranded-DNA-specific exonuclease